jgi:hypothetical protein
MTKSEIRISNGKAIVAAVISSYFTLAFILELVKVNQVYTLINALEFVINILLSGGLFYAIWKGHNWAKWTFYALTAIGIIRSLVIISQNFNWSVVASLAYCFILPVAILYPESVDEFLKDQKMKRSNKALV